VKKFIFILCLVLLCLSGCGERKVDIQTDESVLSTETEKNLESESDANVMTEPLSFLVTKEMQDAGMNTENTELLKTLSDLIEENPEVGEEDDFSILYSGKYGESDGQKVMFFYAINRTDKTLKNISFVITVKVGEEYLVDNLLVELSNEAFGASKPNTAMPLGFIVDEDKLELIKDATYDNMSMEILDFQCENE